MRPAMEGDAEIPTVVVREFGRLWPDRPCATPLDEVALPDQAWRLLTLEGEPAAVADARQEPRLILGSQENAYLATVGCNRLRGRYEVNGPRITFQPGPTTLMACPPPLDVLEQRLQRVLREAAGWAIDGHRLVLRDGAGGVIAVGEVQILR